MYLELERTAKLLRNLAISILLSNEEGMFQPTSIQC